MDWRMGERRGRAPLGLLSLCSLSFLCVSSVLKFFSLGSESSQSQPIGTPPWRATGSQLPPGSGPATTPARYAPRPHQASAAVEPGPSRQVLFWPTRQRPCREMLGTAGGGQRRRQLAVARFVVTMMNWEEKKMAADGTARRTAGLSLSIIRGHCWHRKLQLLSPTERAGEMMFKLKPVASDSLTAACLCSPDFLSRTRFDGDQDPLVVLLLDYKTSEYISW